VCLYQSLYSFNTTPMYTYIYIYTETRDQVVTDYEFNQEIESSLRGSGAYAEVVERFLKNFHTLEKDPSSLCARVRHFLEVLKSKLLSSDTSRLQLLAKQVAAVRCSLFSLSLSLSLSLVASLCRCGGV
jgi:hypothetical protein